MKAKVSPTAIGIFIAGAIVILFASIILFGSGNLFRHTKTYLLTFQEPVTGLDVGSPVKLSGVDVGSVSSVSLGVGGTNDALLINVVVEVDRDQLQAAFTGYSLDFDNRDRFEKTVRERGLRGQLEILSMLSGQMYIALDMYPDMPGFQLDREQAHGHWEIPTLPSGKRELMRSLMTSLGNFAEFDFQGVSEEIKGLLSDLRVDLAKMELDKVTEGLDETLAEVRSTLSGPRLQGAITNLDLALGEVRQLGENLNAKINPLLADVDTDLKKAGTTLDEAVQALRGLSAQLEPTSAFSRELVRTLSEASVALNALRELAQQLQRNPSSLITGKKESQP